jgi:hypothetical protein
LSWKSANLPNCTTVVLAVEPDRSQAEAWLERLAAAAIPNAVAYVATTGKIGTRGLAKSFNIESGYPPEPALLQTLSAWSEVAIEQDRRFRDALELHCLRKVLAEQPDADFAVLLRTVFTAERSWPALTNECRERLFFSFEGPVDEPAKRNVLLYTGGPRSAEFLDLAWEIFQTGAAYGLDPYSLDEVLAGAADALRFAPAR